MYLQGTSCRFTLAGRTQNWPGLERCFAMCASCLLHKTYMRILRKCKTVRGGAQNVGARLDIKYCEGRLISL